MEVKVFDYVERLDCFVTAAEYNAICDNLGIVGWEQTAWIGRYLTLDNDLGEHRFDNWDLRSAKEQEGRKMNR